jgi:hypothetical protein
VRNVEVFTSELGVVLDVIRGKTKEVLGLNSNVVRCGGRDSRGDSEVLGGLNRRDRRRDKTFANCIFKANGAGRAELIRTINKLNKAHLSVINATTLSTDDTAVTTGTEPKKNNRAV